MTEAVDCYQQLRGKRWCCHRLQLTQIEGVTSAENRIFMSVVFFLRIFEFCANFEPSCFLLTDPASFLNSALTATPPKQLKHACTVPCHTWLPIETKTMAELSGFCYIFRQEKKHRNQHSQNFWLNTHVVIGIANDEGWIRNGQKDLNGQNQSDMSTSRFNCSHWIFRQMSWNEFFSC